MKEQEIAAEVEIRPPNNPIKWEPAGCGGHQDGRQTKIWLSEIGKMKALWANSWDMRKVHGNQ